MTNEFWYEAILCNGAYIVYDTRNNDIISTHTEECEAQKHAISLNIKEELY